MGNPALFPPLGDDQGAAMKKIMTNAAIPQPAKMKYLNAWKDAKSTGKMPTNDDETPHADMSLRAVLALMESKAEKAIKDGTCNPKWGKAISGLAGRSFWVVPADQTPSCSTI